MKENYDRVVAITDHQAIFLKNALRYKFSIDCVVPSLNCVRMIVGLIMNTFKLTIY